MLCALITWALKGWQSNHLALSLDATSLGDRFTVLSLSILYRGSACPVAWKIMQANVRHAWKPEWIALLQLVQPLVPAGWTVVVMTDRGLYARWLFQQIVALGWHPLMRITSKSTFRRNGSRATVPVAALVPKPGQRWKGRVVAFPRRARSRLDCTLFACWEFGHEEPWFILTDLEPDQSEGLWYAMRAWIEHGFKLLKSQGWQWQKSRMTDPDRASRLWLVLAVATRYVLAIGGEADASDTDDQTGPLPPFASGTNHTAKQVASRPISNKTTGRPWYTFAASAAKASIGDQRTCDERFPSRNGSIDGRSDFGTCVAEAPLEARTVVGDTNELQPIR